MKASSVNTFDVLNTLDDSNESVGKVFVPVVDKDFDLIMDEKELFIEPRKSRAAVAGVEELMRNLKPKRRGLFDKGKNKVVKVGFATL